jgi:uncharacterized membrane protein SirB2
VTEHFLSIRSVHVAAALASGGLFLLRGIAMWRGSSLGMAAPVRLTSYAMPLVDRWLTTKLGLVVLYVVLGSLALKRAPTPRARRACLLAALLVFATIVVVASDHGAVHWGLAARP